MPYEPDFKGYTVEEPVVEVVVDTIWALRQFAYPDSDLRKIRGRLRSTFEPFSSEQAMLNIMTRCPLMESTNEVSLIPCWQSFWH